MSLLFVFEIKIFIFLYLYFFHTCGYAFCLSVSENIQVDSIKLLSTLATDGQQLGLNLFYEHYLCKGLLFVHFELLVVFCHGLPKGEFVRFQRLRFLCIQNSNVYCWQTMIKTMCLEVFQSCSNLYLLCKVGIKLMQKLLCILT